MNNFSFINSFVFKEVKYTNYHHGDFSHGIKHNYIMYLKEGNAKIFTANKMIEINAGDLLYIPRGLKYHIHMQGTPEIIFYSYAYLHYPGNIIKTYRIQKFEKTLKIMDMLEILTSNNLTNFYALGTFYLLLDVLHQQMESTSTNPNHMILETAMNYIIMNPNCHIPDVAKHCCISEAGLYNLFKKETNTTPAQFKLMAKLEKAFHYIVSTDIPIEEISELCGFSSPSYFRKNFYKTYQKTPSKLRQSLQRDFTI